MTVHRSVLVCLFTEHVPIDCFRLLETTGTETFEQRHTRPFAIGAAPFLKESGIFKTTTLTGSSSGSPSLHSHCITSGAKLDVRGGRSLSRDSRCDLEKQQALLTVRSLIQLTHVSGVQLVAVGVVRAIVAIAENGEDKLRYVALESLAELGE